MIAVIFEFIPEPGAKDRYLDLAAELRPRLQGVDGFISVERFQSLTNPDKLVSISFWRDEEAVARWHADERHRAAQDEGKARLFREYRITVADALRCYGKGALGTPPA